MNMSAYGYGIQSTEVGRGRMPYQLSNGSRPGTSSVTAAKQAARAPAAGAGVPTMGYCQFTDLECFSLCSRLYLCLQVTQVWQRGLCGRVGQAACGPWALLSLQPGSPHPASDAEELWLTRPRRRISSQS